MGFTFTTIYNRNNFVNYIDNDIFEVFVAKYFAALGNILTSVNTG